MLSSRLFHSSMIIFFHDILSAESASSSLLIYLVFGLYKYLVLLVFSSVPLSTCSLSTCSLSTCGKGVGGLFSTVSACFFSKMIVSHSLMTPFSSLTGFFRG